MAEPSNERAEPPVFSRTRLVVGIVLVMVLAVGAVVGLSRFVEGPDPGRLAYVTEEALVLRDLSDGAEEPVVPWSRRWSDPVLDEGGERLAYASSDGVGVLRLPTGDSELVADAGRPVGFDPEGRLVYAAPDGRGRTNLVRLVDGQARSLVPVEVELAGHEGPVLWASADRYIARFLDPEGAGALLVVDLSSDRASLRLSIPKAFPLTVSPDGREVLYATGSPGQLAVLPTGEFGSRGLGFTGEFTVGATSPAGVAAVGGRDADGEPGVWGLRGGEGEPERLADVAPEALVWAHDSSRLFAVVDGGLVEIAVPDGGAEGLGVDVAEDRFLGILP